MVSREEALKKISIDKVESVRKFKVQNERNERKGTKKNS